MVPVPTLGQVTTAGLDVTGLGGRSWDSSGGLLQQGPKKMLGVSALGYPLV
jgi:hypothetical protein